MTRTSNHSGSIKILRIYFPSDAFSSRAIASFLVIGSWAGLPGGVSVSFSFRWKMNMLRIREAGRADMLKVTPVGSFGTLLLVQY